MKGNTAGSEGEYDADRELGEAMKALREAAWRLRIASYALEERFRGRGSLAFPEVYRGELLQDVGASIAIADLLATQIDAIGAQTRRLRKRARNI